MINLATNPVTFAYPAGSEDSVRSAPPTGRGQFFLISELENAIQQLENVQGVRIFALQGNVDEIHVLASNQVKPKMLVRDIETLLQVKFNVGIDHRCISIVQTNKQKRDHPARIIFHGVRRTDILGEPAILAELMVDAQVIQGVQNLHDPTSGLHASGQAVIRAVEKLIGQQDLVKLLNVQAVMLDGRELILAVVVWRSVLSDEILVGATLAGEDRVASAARATLDAINRKLIHLPSLVGEGSFTRN